MRKLTYLAVALVLAVVAAPALAAERYNLDPNHTQVRFSWNHFGYSTMSAAFGEVKAEFELDTADLTKSSVSVEIPIDSLATGVPKLDTHLKSADFFNAAEFPIATFKSASVEKTGDKSLKVAGELTIHGVTRPAVLDVTVNQIGTHPMAKGPAAGFDATTTIKRSEFGIDKYAPAVSDEIHIHISTETHKAK